MTAGVSIHSNFRGKRAFLPQQHPQKPQADSHWDDLGYWPCLGQSLPLGRYKALTGWA